MSGPWEKYAAPAQDGPWSKYTPAPEMNTDPTGSFTENLKAGAGKMLTDLGRGAGQFLRDTLNPSSDVLLKAQGKTAPNPVADAMKLPTQADVDAAKARDKPLMDTAGGMVGNIGMGALVAAPAALLPGGNTAMGVGLAGGVMGALQPVATGESRAANTALGTTVAGGAQAALGKLTNAAQNRATAKAADAATEQAQNATRDAALAAGRKAGYVVPPSTVKPGVVNEALESVAGKVSTAQQASTQNAKVTDSLAREALGLKKGALLTEGSLADLRAQAGKSYQAIKDLPTRFKADQNFSDDVAALGNDFASAAEVVPNTVKNEAIEALRNDLAKGDWTPKGIIEAVKKLRFDAGKNYKSFDDPAKASLADAQRAAADALDGLVERNLAATGQAGMSDAYKSARVLIAKAHDVEASLMADGHINAQVLARIAQKKPLTDQLALIADFAGSFPKAVQPVSKIGGAGVHALRPSIGAAVGSVIGGPVGGMVGAGAGVAVPWTVRSALLSGARQSSMARPTYEAGGQRIADLLAHRATKAALPAGTVGAVFQNRAQQ